MTPEMLVILWFCLFGYTAIPEVTGAWMKF